MSQKIRKLGRTNSAARVAMLRAMVTYLLENGQIKTTVTRAKEVAPLAEKMITLAKDNTLASYRQALAFITKEDVANKLFKEIGPKYADRKGGYTRIVRIGPRRRDGKWGSRQSRRLCWEEDEQRSERAPAYRTGRGMRSMGGRRGAAEMAIIQLV